MGFTLSYTAWRILGVVTTFAATLYGAAAIRYAAAGRSTSWLARRIRGES